jgi:hypothetical protein
MINITLESLIAEAQSNNRRCVDNLGTTSFWYDVGLWLQSKLDAGEQIVAIPAELAGALREWRRWHFDDDPDAKGYENVLASALDKYLPKEGI